MSLLKTLHRSSEKRLLRCVRRMQNLLHAVFVFRSLRLFTACDIALRKLPHSTRFGHPVGIVIGAKVKMGENCTVYQNVTIGACRNGGGYPVVGRDVVIGANACLIGELVVGDGAVVGAGSVVLHDVPAGAVVAGNPARVVKMKCPEAPCAG